MAHTKFVIFFIMLSINIQIFADGFSNIAERANVLDPTSLLWTPEHYPVTLKLYGYVKNEGIFDTRQNFALRDGHFLYFPLDRMPDVLGADINARGDFDEYALQSRWGFTGKGPEICGFESGFLIETEFFGRTDRTLDECDLRFAYLELTSEHLQLLAGQQYHPICYPFESPDTISFNSGVPMAPFAFCPQFKATYQNNHFEFQAAAMGFLGDRPFGLAGVLIKYFEMQ